MPPLSADHHRTERDLIDAIIAGLGRVSSGHLWPGFDPAALPLAVAIPSAPATWLITCDPVEGYEVVEPPALHRQRRDGLDERIVADGVALIAGRLTATIIVDDPTRVVAATALAAHELFHAHQADHYPGWGADEADLLIWPWDDAANIARSTHELSVLHAATAAPNDETCLELARQALATRWDRFATLPAEARGYEDAVELVEGTAHWVEYRTAMVLGEPRDDRQDVNPIDVRRRCYRTGRAWCVLLERLVGPDWMGRLPEGPEQPMPVLPDLLAAAIGPPPAGTDDRWRDGLPLATAEIAADRTRRRDLVTSLRTSLDGSVMIRAGTDGPLRVAGFDPMNLSALADGQVLHERYLALTIGETRITVLNHPTLTTSVGDHPLFARLERAEVLVDDGLILALEDAAAQALTALGLRIDGPYAVRRTGPRTIEITPGTSGPTGR